MQPTQNELITLAKETITAMCGPSARTGIEVELNHELAKAKGGDE